MLKLTKLRLFLVACVLGISLILRLHNYDMYPQRGATSDEYAWSFLGISLLTAHVPTSWSAFPAYTDTENLTIRSLYFPIVTPYLDHPPLAGLLIGGFALVRGEDTFEKVSLSTIRLVPIFFSLISSILVFLLGFKLYNFKTGFWALLIYSTATIFLISSRVALAENILTPLFLGTLYIFYSSLKQMTNKTMLILGVLCGLTFLTKILGIALFISIFYLLVSEKAKPKKIMLFCATFCAFFGVFVLYGALYDFGLFLQITLTQASRQIGPQTLQLLTSTPVIINKTFYDGWYLFGVLCLFFSFFEYQKNKLLIIPSLIYFLLLIFTLTKEGEMGWYIIPLFPFMALATAEILIESLKKKNLFIFVFLLFIGMMHIHYLFEDLFGLTSLQFRFIFGLIFGPFLLLLLIKKDRLYAKLGSFWFYAFIFANIILTYNYVHPA